MMWKFLFWLAKLSGKQYWYCGRCGFIVKDEEKKPCKCKGAAPWHCCIRP